jgi:ubiquinone/menaquinone biosynthesis C-methylase UbiE
MEISQEQLKNAGYWLNAAPNDAARDYDECNPIPGYFEFDWLSAMHPDLYHEFALTTTGFMNELDKLIDLTGLEIIDIGAGTGRVTLDVAKKTKKVTAIDIYESVLSFGRELVAQAGLRNVSHVLGDSARLPFPDNSMDASICAWAVINHPEAYRVLKPGEYNIDLVPAPGALCGDLTALLADVYPVIITEIAPADQLNPTCPVSDSIIQENTWNKVPVSAPIFVHDFTYSADYDDYKEAAAFLVQLYGPKPRKYMVDRQQSILS